MKAAIFLAEGFEEIEAVTVIDLLRRAEIKIDVISITNKNLVIGSHNIVIETDNLLKNIKETDESHLYDCLILPGGSLGVENLKTSGKLQKILQIHYSAGKYIAAICAAPVILGDMGTLNNKTAICYPGYENNLKAKKIEHDKKTVIDDKIITSKSAGTAIDFSLEIIKKLKTSEISKNIKNKIYYE